VKQVLIGLSAVVGIVILVGVLFAVGYVSFSNQANSFEVSIRNKYENNQNVYDNGFKKVSEIAQVPAMQVDALKQIYDAAIKGRYGANGSQATMQWIKEQNPNLDQSTFRKIQQTIEEFRDEFQSNQTALISERQEYERYLSATTSGRFYNMIGNYPHIDMSKFDIVTSDQTEKAFETKKADPLQIAPKH
jgi:hypothetical protein